MEEYEQEERKPIENWSGEERRRGPSGDYKGDERRKAEAAKASGDLTGGKPPIGDSDADEGEGR
jgi:hypothetical protein